MSVTDVIEIASKFTKAYPSISVETLDELVRRRLFHWSGDYWRFGDENNGTTRRLDGRKFTRADNSGADWHKLIGLADVVRHDRKYVLFVIEGSKDALAAAELAFRFGILEEVGIICALGSGYRPIAAEIEELCRRRVGLIGDRDAVGGETSRIISRALEYAGVDHSTWDWSDWAVKGDKDLFDVLTTIDSNRGAGLKLFRAGRVGQGDQISAPGTHLFFSFSSSFPRFNGSTVQRFNCSTQGTEAEGIIGVTIEQFVAPHAVTKSGTGNRKSFDLARAIKTANPNMAMSDITTIFDEWFARSRLFLPRDADRDKSFQTFLKQLTRVRFMASSLKAACERARTAPPPFIPALDGNSEATIVATLCRELQRDAGERGFICPVSVVQQFVDLRWPAQAHWLLHQLELNSVIECVDRGAPNTPGKKGKPTIWRYRFPLDVHKPPCEA
jgi:hypothetical protein